MMKDHRQADMLGFNVLNRDNFIKSKGNVMVKNLSKIAKWKQTSKFFNNRHTIPEN